MQISHDALRRLNCQQDTYGLICFVFLRIDQRKLGRRLQDKLRYLVPPNIVLVGWIRSRAGMAWRRRWGSWVGDTWSCLHGGLILTKTIMEPKSFYHNQHIRTCPPSPTARFRVKPGLIQDYFHTAYLPKLAKWRDYAAGLHLYGLFKNIAYDQIWCSLTQIWKRSAAPDSAIIRLDDLIALAKVVVNIP